MLYSFALHIIGIVLWMGALFAVAQILKIGSEESLSAAMQKLLKKVWVGYMVPGVVLVLLTGFYQFAVGGIGVYMKQGWMHAKLTLVVLLLIVTALSFIQTQKIFSGERASRKVVSLVHAVSGFVLLVVVFLAKLKPF
ncbi:MAG: CopD family protein [Deltaproteobacteria bacterium]|nr:CopD family protein [Deltaproteobacteria bacterium]